MLGARRLLIINKQSLAGAHLSGSLSVMIGGKKNAKNMESQLDDCVIVVSLHQISPTDS